jgi:hypothetical protein
MLIYVVNSTYINSSFDIHFSLDEHHTGVQTGIMLNISKSNREYLFINEAAEFLGLHTNSLRNYDRRGILTARRNHAGFRVYLLRDLQRFAADREIDDKGGRNESHEQSG